MNKAIFIQPILKGKIITNPKYIDQEVDEYKGNPCIEALPKIFNDEYTVRNLASYITPTEEEKALSANIRYHILRRIKNYYQPFVNHLKIEHILSCLIRRSYISRNPNSKEYIQRLGLILEVIEEQEHNKGISSFDLCEKLRTKFDVISETCRSTAESSSIIGISGMGKSTAIEKLLLMYPQLIFHSEYKEKPLTRAQIVWLKIDCPYDGSLKTLCKMFFKALDDILLTTNYFSRYGSNRNSTSTMMVHMSHLACLYSIGVLVIDEMQHLINPKNTPDDILNFLVTLVNTIGISVIQIGTPKVTTVLEKGLREVRRAEEAGSIVWDRMKDDEEWTFFIQNLWDCQWLKYFTPLDEKLKNAMYYETQGITSIAINLFILVQAEAIFSEKEKITLKLIHNVSKSDLRLTQKVINSIRSGKVSEMANYEDISIAVEDVLKNKETSEDYKKRLENLRQQHKQSINNENNKLKEQIITDILSMELFANIDCSKLEKIAENIINQEGSLENKSKIKQDILKAAMIEEERTINENKQVKSVGQKREIYEQKDLRYLFNISEKNKTHIYEILKSNGYIKNPLLELYKQEEVN